MGIAFCLTLVGYLLAMLAAWVLYLNAPRDLPFSRVKVGPNQWGTEADDERIRTRKQWSRRGFLLLLPGTACQGAGAILGLLPAT